MVVEETGAEVEVTVVVAIAAVSMVTEATWAVLTVANVVQVTKEEDCRSSNQHSHNKGRWTHCN